MTLIQCNTITLLIAHLVQLSGISRLSLTFRTYFERLVETKCLPYFILLLELVGINPEMGKNISKLSPCSFPTIRFLFFMSYIFIIAHKGYRFFEWKLQQHSKSVFLFFLFFFELHKNSCTCSSMSANIKYMYTKNMFCWKNGPCDWYILEFYIITFLVLEASMHKQHFGVATRQGGAYLNFFLYS